MDNEYVLRSGMEGLSAVRGSGLAKCKEGRESWSGVGRGGRRFTIAYPTNLELRLQISSLPFPKEEGLRRLKKKMVTGSPRTKLVTASSSSSHWFGLALSNMPQLGDEEEAELRNTHKVFGFPLSPRPVDVTQ